MDENDGALSQDNGNLQGEVSVGCRKFCIKVRLTLVCEVEILVGKRQPRHYTQKFYAAR